MKRILVVDDDNDMIELLKSRFEESGYEVDTASEGVEGLARAKDNKPDLIVLDLVMPVMDGLSFVKDLKVDSNLANIPVIVLTAKDQLQDLFTDGSIEDYITKPFDVEDLLAKAKKLTS